MGIGLPIVSLCLLIILPNGYDEYYIIVQILGITITFEITILVMTFEAATVNSRLNDAVKKFEKWLLVPTIDTTSVEKRITRKNISDTSGYDKKMKTNIMDIINDVNEIGRLKFAHRNNEETELSSAIDDAKTDIDVNQIDHNWDEMIHCHMPILAYWKVRFKGVKLFGVSVDYKLFFRLLSLTLINVLIFLIRSRISWL